MLKCILVLFANSDASPSNDKNMKEVNMYKLLKVIEDERKTAVSKISRVSIWQMVSITHPVFLL
jgi:hypothetical protein